MVVTEVFLTTCKQAASDLLKKFEFRVPVPPKERPKGLGDEALLYQTGNSGSSMILFRKSNVFILITGSSVMDARRFSDHIADVIPNK